MNSRRHLVSKPFEILDVNKAENKHRAGDFGFIRRSYHPTLQLTDSPANLIGAIGRESRTGREEVVS